MILQTNQVLGRASPRVPAGLAHCGAHPIEICSGCSQVQRAEKDSRRQNTDYGCCERLRYRPGCFMRRSVARAPPPPLSRGFDCGSGENCPDNVVGLSIRRENLRGLTSLGAGGLDRSIQILPDEESP